MAFTRAPKTMGRLKRFLRRRRPTKLVTVRSLDRKLNSGARKRQLDSSAALTEVTTTPTVFGLNLIAAGDGLDGRNGQTVAARRLEGRIELTPHSTIPSIVRILIVRDKQQISDSAISTVNVLTSAIPTALTNPAALGRYDILMDRVYTLPSVSTLDRDTFVRFSLKLNFPMKYNGTASTDVQKNGIWCIAFSDGTTGNCPSWAYRMRLHYTD